MKEFLYKKIIKKDEAKELLCALDLKNISFDKLWIEKLHTMVILLLYYLLTIIFIDDILIILKYIYLKLLTAIRSKRGYYVRRVKQSLWGSFGIHQLQPFKENWKKDDMKAWKADSKTKDAYEKLYERIDPDDQQSDTYVAKIIKETFAKNERTELNTLWTQAVLEIIFDSEHLSPKLDTDIVDKRFEMLKNGQEQE